MNKDDHDTKPPGGTQDERLLETPSADEFLHTDTWRVFRIMGEFVQGFEDLADIQNGTFAREWIKENKDGGYNFADLRQKEQQHPIEIVGAQLRGMMSWLPGREAKKGPEAPKEPAKQVVNA